MQRRMTRIEEMAAYNLTHLRKVQAHGPYYLSSDCLATLIVLEMAQQLLAQGEAGRGAGFDRSATAENLYEDANREPPLPQAKSKYIRAASPILMSSSRSPPC